MTLDASSGGVQYSAKQIERGRELLSRISAARRTATFYPEAHPAFSAAVGRLADTVGAYHAEGVDVELAFFEGEILLGQSLLAEESVSFDQLTRDFTSIGATSIVIRQGVTVDELERAVRVLANDPEVVQAHGGAPQMVREQGVTNVEVTTVRAVEPTSGPEMEAGDATKGTYERAMNLMREMDRLLDADQPIPAEQVERSVRSLVDNVLANRYAMLKLAAIKNHDDYLFQHSVNVAVLSLALGSVISSDYRFLSSLGTGALLHDLGQLAIDRDIITKPGALTAEEWETVQKHPVLGAQMVSLLPGVDRSAVVIALEHHMRFDLQGYPRLPSPKPQHLASRIVSVADCYDAMTSDRSYSAARVQDDAMAALVKSAGTALDPALVRLFVHLMGVYPPRSVVRLSTGEVAIVLEPHEADPLLPRVRVIADATGALRDPSDLDLVGTQMTIRACIDPRLVNIDVEDYV